MPARGMKGTRLRRVGAGIAVSALVATASGLGLAAAAPLGAPVGAAATTANASALVPITPTRVLDTRTSSPLGQGQTLDLKLTAPGPVPADGVGAVLNVTLDGATTKSFVTVWPAGEARPLASTNNAEPGLITPNSMTAKLGANGSVSIYNANGSTNVVIDVVGYLIPMDKVVVSGSQFWVGATAPTTSQGKVGDTYFDSGNKALYGPKDANGWGPPTDLTGQQGAVGPQGDVGLTGDVGPTGPQGDVGPTGPQGDVGLTGDVGPAGPAGPAAYLYASNTSPETIFPGGPGVTFDTLVKTVGGITAVDDTNLNGAGFMVAAPGVYKVSFAVVTKQIEPLGLVPGSQLTLEVNGLDPAGLDPAQGSTVFGSSSDGPLSGTTVLTLVTGDTILLANLDSASDFDLDTPVGGTGPSLNAWILIEQLS